MASEWFSESSKHWIFRGILGLLVVALGFIWKDMRSDMAVRDEQINGLVDHVVELKQRIKDLEWREHLAWSGYQLPTNRMLLEAVPVPLTYRIEPPYHLKETPDD